MTPPAIPGNHTVVLIGPAPVVFAALAVNLVVFRLLIRARGNTDAVSRRKLISPGESAGMVTTGLLGSLLTTSAVTIAVNVLIGQIARFSN
jgi:hypothetical protein